MGDPTVGAFGLCAGVMVLVMRWTSFDVVAPNVLLVGGLWCASRTVMAVTVRVVPYARTSGGLATRFLGTRRWVLIAGSGALVAVGLGILGDGIIGVAAIGVAAVSGVGVVAFCRARLGGFTGDVLGAAGMIAETMGLLLVASRW